MPNFLPVSAKCRGAWWSITINRGCNESPSTPHSRRFPTVCLIFVFIICIKIEIQMIQISLKDTQCLHIIDNASDFPILEMIVVDKEVVEEVDDTGEAVGGNMRSRPMAPHH